VNRHHGKTLGAPSGFSKSHLGGAPQSSSPASGGARPSAPTAPAAVNPGRSAPTPSRGVSTPAGGSGGTTRLPSVKVPTVQAPVTANQVGGTVKDTVTGAGQAVGEAVEKAADVTGALPKLGG
jgi:hypothetical protein